MPSKKLVSVVGPTGIGKTKMAIVLAQHFKTEILSADSRQFFREMTIGTAVPSPAELASVTHHFIQHKSILEKYSVGDFEQEAISFLDGFFKNHTFAILVGGSGLYVDAVTKGLDSFPKIDEKIRVRLNQRLSDDGLEALQGQLKQLDPEYYEIVDLENPHRVIRALEVCLGSGLPYTSFLEKEKPERGFRHISVGIKADREIIYNRINKRVDIMMEEGLLEEAKMLYQHKDLNALQTVGYRELFAHFEGKWDLDFAISEIKKNTRRFAKRQLTWYRKRKDILWVDYDLEIPRVIDLVEKRLQTI